MPFKLPPSPVPKSSLFGFTIGALLHGFTTGPGYVNPGLPRGTRFILGYPLPVFQRGLVWTEEQKIKFIESIWHDFPLGTYMVNEVPGPDCYSHPLHDLLIDGQQRLKALEDYFSDKFEVFGSVWTQVPEVESRRFRNKQFGRQVISTEDEAALRLAYNQLNFGGVRHSDADRA